MDIEFEFAPACCRQSVERIHDIIDTVGCLQEFMAVAPAIAKPTPTISPLGIIWRLGTGTWSWRKFRKSTSKTLQPIIQNRITQVVDFEILRHNNNADLMRQWQLIRKEYQR